MNLLRHGRRRAALPFQPPKSALAKIQHEVGPKRHEAGPSGVADGGIDDTVAVEFLAQAERERLSCRIGERRIILKSGFGSPVNCAEVMKWPEEVRDKLGIVSHVLEAPDGLKFAREMIGHLAETGFHIEPAVPGAPIIAVKSVAAWSRVGERCIDESVAGAPKDELAGIKVGQTRLLRLEAAVGNTLQICEVIEGALGGGKRQEHGLLESTR